MKRILVMTGVLILMMLVGTLCHAQTVGPTALEFKGGKGHGTVFVSNPGTAVFTVDVRFQSFDWKDGNPYLAPAVDPAIHAETKQATFKLGPGQSKYIDFAFTCAQLPCHFYITPVFTAPMPEQTGFAFARWMPIAIYSCSDRQKGCRKETLAAHGAL